MLKAWRQGVRVASVCAALAACDSGGGAPTGSACPTPSDTTTPLTWDNFGQDFMVSNCTRCHGTFRSQGGVKSNIAAIDAWAAAGPDATNRDMPPSNGISDEERALLGEWLACGAP